ncbi:MAG: BatD family protein [Deltaproteobacteria bacterium]|nr:BatD family protein [Deltaproteobacteria bacterium]
MIAIVASVALAAQVVLQLDEREVRAGETIGLTLQVVDARLKVAPKIDAPPGLRVSFLTQTSTRATMNFSTVNIQTFRYEVAALEAGDYTLGPVELTSAEGTISAPAVSLHVAARPAGSLDKLVADLGQLDGVAYVGQVLVYHLAYKTSSRLINARWAPPEVEGLTPEPNIEPVTTEYDLVDPVGKSAELWYAYRASKPGKIEIAAGVLLAQFATERRRRPSPFGSDPFFGDLPGLSDVRTESVASERIPIEIRALPAGAPPGFTGLVGEFTVDVQASATRAAVGDTVTLDVTVAGTGPLGGVKLPHLGVDGLRVYDDTPVVGAALSEGRLKATAQFKRAIVPERPGTIELPPLALSWFDPVRGEYVVHQGEALRLDVSGRADEAAVEGFGGSTVNRSAVASLGDDILPVRTDPSTSSPLPGHFAWTLLVPGSLMLLGEAVSRLRPQRRAAVAARVHFDELPADPEARLGALERLFREAAARRLDCAEGEVTRERVAGLGEEALHCFRELELARYRGAGTVDEPRLRRWVEGR